MGSLGSLGKFREFGKFRKFGKFRGFWGLARGLAGLGFRAFGLQAPEGSDFRASGEGVTP